ncbi:MAG TPA: hypothetical protein VLH15_08875 [Dehalococcoidales bacterium]|nr:hypothetical protein [Dehalococcoidales bacterium]
MAERKYEHLIKPLKIAEMKGQGQAFRNTGNADVNRWLNGRDHLNGVELNFSWGFYTGLGDWHPGMDPHVHPYPEALVFVGLDPHRPEYLGAKIDFYIGKELEFHTFDKPTAVIAPGGFVHCPLITTNVNSPIGYSFFIISLGADPTTAWLGDGLSEEQLKQRKEMEASAAQRGVKLPMKSSYPKQRIHFCEETITHGHLYDKFYIPMKPNTQTARRLKTAEKEQYGDMLKDGRKPGPGLSGNAVWLFGQDMDGIKLNFCWAIHTQPGLWMRGPGKGAHVHPVDEVLVFAGTDPSDIDCLGAEIQIDLGPEHDRYIIDKPTAVICPAGFPHNPIVTRWVDRPFGVLMISLGTQHETSYID